MRAAARARSYICRGIGSAEKIAEDTAEAFALAVATASAKCELEGTTELYVNAHAHAKAAGEVFVAAYSDAFAAATDCDTCQAYAQSWGYIEKTVFLEAIAKAGVYVRCYPSPLPPLCACTS